MLEILLLLAAGLLGWFFARRQKPTEPVIPPKPNPQRETYVDRIDEITRHADAPTASPDSDSDLARWLDDTVGGGRK